MIGDKDLSIPEKMLDLYALRHKLIANNIANAEVPGYRKLDVKFGKELERAMASGDPARVRKVRAKVTSSGAPVQAESEVARMAKNEVLFDTFAEIASFRLRMLRAAIEKK